MELAVGYARVSTIEQAAGGVSLAAQAEKIRAYCALNGLTLTRVVMEEGVSAAIPLAERPGGRELLAAIATNGVRHVVALKLDRLFRDAIDCLSVVRQWDKTGIALHLVDQGGQAINTQSALGRFFLTILAGVSEMEKNLISERTKLALQYKRRSLKVYGRVPYGFTRNGEELVPAPEEVAVIRLVHDMRAAGLGYKAIARELRARGIPTKNGGKWAAATVKKLLARAEEVLSVV